MALPRPLAMPWQVWALAPLLALSVILSVGHMSRFVYLVPFDWWTFGEATERIGNLYAWEGEYTYRYSPLFAYVMVPFVEMGLGVWRLLHVAVLAFLPWRIAGLALLLWPFWDDVGHGNVMTFAMVAGYLAMQGSRWGTGAYLALTLLVPRPLMFPLAAWIVWKRPEWRLPALGIAAVFAVLTLATGEAGAFLSALVNSGDAIDISQTAGPSRFLGAWWLLIGVPLGVFLFWRGRPALAGLAVMPYLLLYHWLLAMVELVPKDRQVDDRLRHQRVVGEPVALGR